LSLLSVKSLRTTLNPGLLARAPASICSMSSAWTCPNLGTRLASVPVWHSLSCVWGYRLSSAL